MPSAEIRSLLRATSSFFLTIVAIPLLMSYSFAGSGTLTVSGTQSGVTSQYLGANEGSSQFNINDLVDLGINTYRLYGGMSRWEPTDATSSSGTYFLLLPEVRPPSGTYYDSSQNTAWDTYFNVS